MGCARSGGQSLRPVTRHGLRSGTRRVGAGAANRIMKHSTDRILTTHVGRLPFPDNHAEIMQARASGDERTFDEFTTAAIADLVRRQTALGIDIMSDGEFW